MKMKTQDRIGSLERRSSCGRRIFCGALHVRLIASPSFFCFLPAKESASDRRMVRNSQELLWQTSNMQYGDFYNSEDAQ
ncbi:hypothetical protein L7F22_024302, partial [Adiantum nelumboides]|nr:hypothetical protein [Adiantum nelumboides]